MIWILPKAKARKRVFQFAAQKKPAPLEKPQDRKAGPALPFCLGCEPKRRKPWKTGLRQPAYVSSEPGL
jgi:hypothetical protein